MSAFAAILIILTGKILIPLSQLLGYPFDGDLAPIAGGASHDLFGFIDTKGKTVIRAQFLQPAGGSNLSQSFEWIGRACRVSLPDGEQALIDTSGKILWQQQ